jgi:hypothetical protein
MLVNTTEVTFSEVLFKTTVTTLGWVPITIVVVLLAVVAQLTGPLRLWSWPPTSTFVVAGSAATELEVVVVVAAPAAPPDGGTEAAPPAPPGTGTGAGRPVVGGLDAAVVLVGRADVVLLVRAEVVVVFAEELSAVGGARCLVQPDVAATTVTTVAT